LENEWNQNLYGHSIVLSTGIKDSLNVIKNPINGELKNLSKQIDNPNNLFGYFVLKNLLVSENSNEKMATFVDIWILSTDIYGTKQLD